jgi:hypothetical protein
VVLNGLSVGVSLWEGLGETEYGRSQGFFCGDRETVEAEREEMGYPPDFPLELFWPDGVKRDRERARKSLAVIVERPVWYSGVMLTRMYWMLKVAGEPGAYYGTAGINCTAAKCLPPAWQPGALAVGVNTLGAMQSIYRYAAMLFAACGIWFGFRLYRQATWLLIATILYYLISGTAGHTELRYMLPMHAVLVIFGGLGFTVLASYGRSGLAFLGIGKPGNKSSLANCDL